MSHSVLHPTLYTPATTPATKQLALVNGTADIAAWNVVLCTEDSISEADVPEALETLAIVLAGANRDSGISVFIRVRTPEVMAAVLTMDGADKLRGFVLPKTDPASFPAYADQVLGTDFRLMPILESPLMMDRHFRETLRTVLTDTRYYGMIDCLRIGANDLMGHLGIRRDDSIYTVYDTPVGNIIHDIINEFRGLAGFTITAPVFECFGPEYDELLAREVKRHLMNGLLGQTIIHPRHIRRVRDLYKVSATDYQSAKDIVEGAAAVVGINGKMDEYATHRKWAELMLERHALFGDSAVSQTLAEVL